MSPTIFPNGIWPDSYLDIGVVIFGQGQKFPSFLPTKIEKYNFINLFIMNEFER
jgi:hypothetical protein